MPYVLRDDTGNITAMFANLQPGYAEEYLPDDNLEVVAFMEKVTAPAAPQPAPADVLLYNHENRIRAIEGAPPLTLGEFLAKVKP